MPSGSKLKDLLRPVVLHARNRRNTALYGSCAVVLYHRVIALVNDPQQLAVDPEHFEQHLKLLKEKYQVLTVEEFDHHLLNAKKFPKNSVLLTFDDGYADNNYYARPILEKQGLQALFYISSGYMGAKREYWWDELERLLLANDQLPNELHFLSHGVELSFKDGTGDRLAEYDRMLEALRCIPSKDRDEVLTELRVALNSEMPRSTHLPMTINELQDFATSRSVVIGAHTVGHPSLARLNEEEQRKEIEGSKQALEEMLGIKVPYFSYPFGTGADFNATTEKLVQAVGFTHVAANYQGIVHARSPLFKFPRFLVRNWNGAEFHQRLSGFFKA